MLNFCPDWGSLFKTKTKKMKKITEKEAYEWICKNKNRHKWVTWKMLSEFANDKIKELNQNKEDERKN